MSYLLGLAVLGKAIKKKNSGSYSTPSTKTKTAYDIAVEKDEMSKNREIDFLKGIRFAVGYDHNPILTSFFKDIYEYGKRIDNLDAKKYNNMNEILKEELSKKVNVITESLSLLESFGIKGYDKEGVSFYKNPEISDEKEILSWPNKFKLDGITICLKDLEQMRLSYVEEERKEILNELSEYSSEEDLKKELTKLEKRHFFINKEKQQERIKKIKSDLEKISMNKARLEELEKIEKKFLSLSPEQINIMKNVLETSSYLNKFIKDNMEQYNLTFDAISNIYGYNAHNKYHLSSARSVTNNTERKRAERILRAMEKDGKFSEKRINSIAIAINEVKNKLNEGYYQEKIWMYNEYEYLKETKYCLSDIQDFFSLLDSDNPKIKNIKEEIKVKKL